MKVQTKDLINMYEVEGKALKQLVVTVSEKVITRLLEKQAEGKKGWDSESKQITESLMFSIINNTESLMDKSADGKKIQNIPEEEVMDLICSAILLWNRI